MGIQEALQGSDMGQWDVSSSKDPCPLLSGRGSVFKKQLPATSQLLDIRPAIVTSGPATHPELLHVMRSRRFLSLAVIYHGWHLPPETQRPRWEGLQLPLLAFLVLKALLEGDP